MAVKIHNDKMKLACNRWHEVMSTELIRDFSKWLTGDRGWPLTNHGRWGTVWVVSEEAAAKIDMLLGPHWYAVLKAIKAKQSS